MKNLIITFALLFSISLGLAQESNTKKLKTELTEIVSLEKDKLPTDMNKTEFVILSFKVKQNGKINVLDINYSNEEIKSILVSKLANAIVENKYIASKIHYYKILFKRL
jgi:hypothetical protein